MSYRDDYDSLRARAESLESRLATAEEEVEKLRAELIKEAAARVDAERERDKLRRRLDKYEPSVPHVDRVGMERKGSKALFYGLVAVGIVLIIVFASYNACSVKEEFERGIPMEARRFLDTEGENVISREQVVTAFQGNAEAFSRCLGEGDSRVQEPAHGVVVVLGVEPTGEPRGAMVSGPLTRPALLCLEETIGSMRFPSSDRATTNVFTFTLYPDGRFVTEGDSDRSALDFLFQSGEVPIEVPDGSAD